MKKFLIANMSLIAISIPQVFSQTVIEPVNQLDFPDPLISVPNTIETPVQLFILNSNPQNNDELNFGFHRFSISSGPGEFSVAIPVQSKITMSVSSGEVINGVTEIVDGVFRFDPNEGRLALVKNPNQPLLFDIVHDVSSVIIQDQTILLEDAYFEGIIPFDSTGSIFQLLNISLAQAAIASNQQWIGGLITRISCIDCPGGRGSNVKIPTLWDINGNLIFQVQFPPPIHVLPDRIFFTQSEVKFSPDSRFFITRGLADELLSVATPNGPESIAVIPFPGSFMLDTQTMLKWETERDVAFTSDSRFFVTERNGVPTLVDARQNRNLQVYDIGEVVLNLFSHDDEDGIPTTMQNIMLAATFSNDDQWLYIAAVDGKVYVFPSQLPTSHVEDWELYAKAE